jgi:hypothetical protein
MAFAEGFNSRMSVWLQQYTSGINNTVTWSSRADYAAGSATSGIATGDLNNDGYPDIATANINSANISVFINNGNGTFAAKVDYGANFNACGISIGDVNRDGYKDILATNCGANNVSVFLNNGNGTFAAKVDYATGTYPINPSLADFDRDGMLDIVVPNRNSNTVSVFLNNGNGTFAAKVDYTTGTNPSHASIGDFNGDGWTDIIAPNNGSNTVSVFLNNGNGTFAAKVDYATGTGPAHVAVGDFNKDGFDDVTVTNSGTTTVSYLQNNGNGTFATKIDYTVNSQPKGLQNADMNNDGLLDIVVANFNSNNASILTNISSPIARTPAFTSQTTNTKLNIIADADQTIGNLLQAQDNEGNLLAALNAQGQLSVGGAPVNYARLQVANTGIRLTTSGAATGSSPRRPVIADFNGDNKQDVALVQQGSTNIAVSFGDGTGGFTFSSNLTTAGSPADLVAADFNNDGRTDLAVSNTGSVSMSVFINNGDGTFATKVDYTAGSLPFGITTSDFNLDGYPDIAVNNYAGGSGTTVSVFLNNGNGTFATKVDYTTGTGPTHITSGDFNRDGKPDIAVSNSGASGAGTTFSVLMNNGNGTFATKVDYTTGANPVDITKGDLNNDGALDIAVTDANSGTISVFINTGTGTFAAKADYTAGSSPYGIALSDLNSDGFLDLSVVNSGSTGAAGYSTLLNNGNGTFAAKVDFNTGNLPLYLATADFTADGRPDVFIANFSSNTYTVFVNRTTTGRASESSTGTISITSRTATDGGLFIQGAVGQTASLFVVQDSYGNGLMTLDAVGNLRVKGAITGGVGAPDYAENITTSDPSIEAADVVMMDPDHPEQVIKAAGPYNQTVLGVISTNPGFVTNASEPDADDETQRPLALSGRVPVKVTGENGPIEPGDYLTTSSTAGYAMKATESGAVIGRAMEGFNGSDVEDTGKVLMFIDNTSYNPAASANMQGSSLTLAGAATIGGDLNVAGATTLANLQVTGNVQIGGVLTAGGHIVSQGVLPVITVGEALGTTLGGVSPGVAIDGTDSAASVDLGSGGQEQVSGVLAHIEFNKPYDTNYRIVLTASNEAASDLRVYVSKSETGFDILTKDIPLAGVDYQFDYIIIASHLVDAN